MKLVCLQKSFEGTRVLDDLSAELPERGLVGVTGASGTGKTTLLRILAGLDEPDAGSVEGRPERVSMQFEDDRLFPWMDVLSNVTLVGCDERSARELLGELGLAGKERSRVAELSGGQRRRVALARALAFPAQLVLLDEPTARLDEGSASAVLDAVRARCACALVVTATHDSHVVDRCDMVLHVNETLNVRH